VPERPAPVRDEQGKFATTNVAPETKVRVKIDGVEREVTVEELRRNFQMGEAARARLTRAAEAEREAAATLYRARAEAQRIAQANVANPEAPAQAATGNDDADEIANVFAYGTREEIAAAVRRLRGNGMPQQAPVIDPGSVVRAVDDRLRAWQTAQQAQNDLAAFSAQHREVVQDEDMQVLVAQRGDRLMRENFRNLLLDNGRDPSVVDGLSSAQLGYHYRDAERMNLVPRALDVLSTAAGQVKAEYLGQAATQAKQAIDQKVDAKRALPRTPSAASVRAPAPRDPRPPTPSEIIAQEREARGLTVYR
jgi:hypothetical protein